MDRNAGCPPARALAELIDGQLVEPDLSELSQHLEDCPACQERARTQSPSDTLVESLRGEAPAEDRIARAVPRPLVERLMQIPQRVPRAASGTVGLSHDAAAPPEGPEFHFLVPEPDGEAIGRLGPYRLLKVLGRGGMGAVFLAEDPMLKRLVALKVMLPKLAANPTAKDRFLREARAAANLKSDHVVTIYQVDEADGIPYLAMERLEGQSLEDVLRAGTPLRISLILHIARDVARGLAVAHEKGLIHRDIKPSNLWMEHPPLAPEGRGAGGEEEADPRVKILDFGLAWAEAEDIHLTQSGAIVGTPAYIAPEQARGGKALDARADHFSLGCVLYRLCAGDVPFKAETTMGTLLAVALDEPTPPSRLNSAIPPELSQLIMQLLEKDPNRRPRSARDVIVRLAEIERSLRGGDAAIAPPAPAPAPPRSGPSRRRGPPVRTLSGLLAAALVALAGAVYYWQMPDGRVVRIECDDPAIRVAFQDGELKVAGAYKDPVTFKPGKVALRVIRKGADGDDFEFETDKLVVNRGDKIVLKIEVAAGKVQIVQAGKGVLDSKGLTPPIVNPNRRAADVATILTSPDYEWTEPIELGPVLNPGQCYGTPFVSADGLELYFDMLCDAKAEGLGGEDLWISRRKSPDAPWNPPVNLGAPINTQERDRTPTLSADCLTMIFWRYLPFCLFETHRMARDAPWSEPVMVQGSANGGSPVLSSDGLELYSNQLGKICRATRTDRTAEWGSPEPVDRLGATFWREPCWLSADGRWLLGVDRKDETYDGCWLAHRGAPDQPWGESKLLDLHAGLKGMQFPFPVLTPSGLELYFSRDQKLHVVRRVPKAKASAG